MPSVKQESARDLVRAREDCRGDLIAAQAPAVQAAAAQRDRLLRRGRLDRQARGLATPRRAAAADLEDRPGDRADLRQRLRGRPGATLARRRRLDTAIEQMAADSEFTPLVRRLGCLRGIGAATGFALAVEIGDWHRFTGNSIGSFVGLVPHRTLLRRIPKPGLDHQDRQHPRPLAAGRGRLAPQAPVRDRQDHARPVGPAPPQPPGSAATKETGDSTSAGSGSLPARNAAPSPTSPSPASSPVGAGPWPSSSKKNPRSASSTRDRGGSAWSDPRRNYQQPAKATLDPRHADHTPAENPPCGNQPAHIGLTARRPTRSPTARRRSTRRPPRTPPRRAPHLLTGSHPYQLPSSSGTSQA